MQACRSVVLPLLKDVSSDELMSACCCHDRCTLLGSARAMGCMELRRCGPPNYIMAQGSHLHT